MDAPIARARKRGTRRLAFVGTAGWSIPRAAADEFPGEGAHLERYSRVLRCAEINASFHRSISPALYAKWAAQTPRSFRFSVKLPKTITHDARLKGARKLLDRFLAETAGLGQRRGPILVQLPPSFAFEARVARTFFRLMRERGCDQVAVEPRNATWFDPPAEKLLLEFGIARAAADPVKVPAASEPGGYPGLVYYRLHGAPRVYWDRYPEERIGEWAHALRRLPAKTAVWCIFDNTAGSGAVPNALELVQGMSDAPAEAGSAVHRLGVP